MGNDIEISKTTALLLAGLFVAIVVGGYVAFGAGAKGTVAAASGVPAAFGGTAGSAGPGSGTAGGDAGSPAAGAQAPQQVQDIYIKALSTGGYDHPQVSVRKGIPVRLHFSADSGAGCGRAFYLDGFNVRLVSNGGEEQVAEFTPDQAGTFAYHCGMWMFRGSMVVS